MALSSTQFSDNISILDDITKNLHSLEFKKAFNNDELNLLLLRELSHAITVFSCAHSVFLVSLINGIRQIYSQMNQSSEIVKNRKKVQSNGLTNKKISIGIIGCGRLGSQLAHCLISLGELEPDELSISTRRPETLVALQEKGVHCYSDNVKVSTVSDVLFLCCPPSQLKSLSAEIKNCLNGSSTIVFSFLAAVGLTRLQRLLGTTNVICPHYRPGKPDQPWDVSTSVLDTLYDLSTVKTTSPLLTSTQSSIVQCDPSLLASIFYACVNHCTTLGMTRSETVHTMDALLFKTQQGESGFLVEEDITNDCCLNKPFPSFELADLLTDSEPETKPDNLENGSDSESCTVITYDAGNDVSVTESHSGQRHRFGRITKRFKTDTALQLAFSEAYVAVFDQYLRWKNHSVNSFNF